MFDCSVDSGNLYRYECPTEQTYCRSQPASYEEAYGLLGQEPLLASQLSVHARSGYDSEAPDSSISTDSAPEVGMNAYEVSNLANCG